MMLQGHFVSSLLSDSLKDSSNTVYAVWEYFRGNTAPVFFTVTGFIFMFLLLKNKTMGWKNPRVKKGIKRGLSLIIWGYVLRLGILGVFSGYVHEAYFYTDVLHIIGLSLLLLIGIYGATYKYSSKLFNGILLGGTILIFFFERYYDSAEITFLPTVLSHYLTKANGAVFSLFPWFGYVSIGAYLASLFMKYQHLDNFYEKMPMNLGAIGLFLMFLSTPFLLTLGEVTGITAFTACGDYNYLFSRLGDVFVVFTIFVYCRNYLNHSLFIKIGRVTLSIYIVHHIILYGSWFHTGLYRWFHHSLSYTEAFWGAIGFIAVVCYLVLQYRDLVNSKTNALIEFVNRQWRIMRVAYVRANK